MVPKSDVCTKAFDDAILVSYLVNAENDNLESKYQISFVCREE